jgi:hypothetical protein
VRLFLFCRAARDITNAVSNDIFLTESEQKEKEHSVMLLTEHHAKRRLPFWANDIACGDDFHFANDAAPEGVMGKHHTAAPLGSNIIVSVANNIACPRDKIRRINLSIRAIYSSPPDLI